MDGLSVLIFTKDNLDGSLELIKNVYDIADEIILGDSSSPKIARSLERECAKLDKVHLFHCIPLGYPDPMRMYGLKRCRYNWVLLMDSDEHLNDKLKHEIKNITANSSADGFLINRITVDDNKKLITDDDYQLRLYRKAKAHYLGMPHEFPIINGKVETLKKKYTIVQKMEIDAYTSDRYKKRIITLESFTRRLTYTDLRNKIATYQPTLGKLVSVYSKIRGARHDEEIGRFEYGILGKYPAFNQIRKSFPRISPYSLRLALDYEKMKLDYYMHLSKDDRLLQLNIAHEVAKNKGGVTGYLELEDNKVVNALNKKFLGRKIRGELLLGWLFYLRYTYGKKYYLRLTPFDNKWVERFG